MSDSKLLRFVDPQSGPVTSIISVPYSRFLHRTLWHSRALLAPHLAINPGSAVFESCGSGWDKKKQNSQSKAVTEAVERWALCFYAKDPGKAGLEIDGTSTGFAALPEDLGEERVRLNAYCEALERWLLNLIWNEAGISLKEGTVPRGVFTALFDKYGARAHLYGAEINSEAIKIKVSDRLYFSYCLLRTREGGVLPGSACGKNMRAASDRALAEAYMHLLALDRLKKKSQNDVVDILEKRVVFFGSDPGGFERVVKKLRLTADAVQTVSPEIAFSKKLSGPWEPEIVVWRVIIKNSRPFLAGGVDRFLI
jgi:hypothetical protein